LIHAGKPFKLRPWQWEKIIKPLYATGPDGRRLKRQALVTIPLEQALMAFAKGHGSSIMTITCANPDTYEHAKRDPEKYDLLRARIERRRAGAMVPATD